VDSFVLIIFGITGNLSQIKLIPALYDIAEKNLLPKNTTIVGIARHSKTRIEFEDYISEVLHLENKHHKHQIKEDVLKYLTKQMFYLNGTLDDPNFYQNLKVYLKKLDKKGKTCQNKIFYLATYPDLYQPIFKNLKISGLNSQDDGWSRLMIEKPIGNDLESSKTLNNLLLKYFSEDQIFRLDHYLGKETLQNILTFRFGNGIFEPLINSEHVDHIQITASEDFGIGMRGGYYDSVGALRDFAQNHILQMIALTTMNPPTEFSKDAITKERIKILKSLKAFPKKLVLGQYKGYKKEPNVNPLSKADTFYAFKTEIENERFKGVPIYIRGGKNLTKWVTEISIVFKVPVNRLIKHKGFETEPNVLIYRVQPNEGIVLKILTKKPGHEDELQPEYMQYCYPQGPLGSHALVDPYEKLIFDAIKGEQIFFNEAEEVESEWKYIDELSKNLPNPLPYEVGSWGPKEADELLKADGREWLEPSMEFCRL
jgi:glucose-6-phosphate 1-dehydrogenase